MSRGTSPRVHIAGGGRFRRRSCASGRRSERLGILVVELTADADGRVVGTPQVFSRGVLDPAVDGAALAEARREVCAALSDAADRGIRDDASVAEVARLAARRAVARVVGSKAVTVARVTRVGAVAEGALVTPPSEQTPRGAGGSGGSR